MSRSPVPLLLVLCSSLLCLAAPAGAQAYTIGMSDQKLGMWQDPRFAKLGITQVRLLMAYDNVLRKDFSRYDAWMTAAHRRGADVLLTIDRDIGSYTRMPTLKQYRRIVRILRKRYPWVETYGAWNEANHVKQPTYRKPRRAAQYYNILREECAGCTILAADLLDPRTCSRGSRPSSATRSTRSSGACTPTRTPTTSARSADVHARAAQRRQGRRLAHRGRRHRPLRHPLPRRPGR